MITNQLDAYISYLNYLEKQATKIDEFSTTIDDSADQLASLFEETTATTQQLASTVLEEVERAEALNEIIVETNKVAASLK